MTRSFDGLTESPASIEEIHGAFGREDYWQARIAASAVPTTLGSLVVDADGTVNVRVTQYLGRQLLPGPAAKFVADGLKLVQTETWTPDADRQVGAQISVAVTPGLGSCRAEAWLTPIGNGSRLRFTGQVEVKIPLVGGALEKSIGASLAQNIPDVMHFTTTWIAEHA